ncbi:MAG: hypothetical protein HONBIEJF_02132 [Fimbriimonadaceae bacterium]|nr:hypothetical protein [Fimbriimonadaceae bacterium]
MRKMIQKWWPFSPLIIVIVACGGSGTLPDLETQTVQLVTVNDDPPFLRPNEAHRAKVSSQPLPGEAPTDTFGFVADVEPPGAATVTFDKESAVPSEEVGMTITPTTAAPDSLRLTITIKRTNPKGHALQAMVGDRLVTYTVQDEFRPAAVDGSLQVSAVQSPVNLVRGQSSRVKFNVTSTDAADATVLQGIDIVSGESFGTGITGDNPCRIPANSVTEKEIDIAPSESCSGGSVLLILYDPTTKRGRGAGVVEFTTSEGLPGKVLLELEPANLGIRPHDSGICMAKVTSLNGYAGDVTVEVVPFDTRILSLMEPAKPKTVKLAVNGSENVKIRFYRVGDGRGPQKVVVKASTPDGFSVEQTISIQYD